MSPDTLSFLTSLSDEVLARSERVRHLIGNAHWGHDGTLKESVLADALAPYLPSTHRLATGFVVDPLTLRCSREQDLLIADSDRNPPIFASRTTAICAPRTVRVVLSVKSQLRRSEFLDAAGCVASAKRLCFESSEVRPFGILFSYKDPAVTNATIQGWIRVLRSQWSLDELPDVVVSASRFSLTRRDHQYVARRTKSLLGVALTVSNMLSAVTGEAVTQFGELVDAVLEDAGTNESLDYLGIAEGPMNEKPTTK